MRFFKLLTCFLFILIISFYFTISSFAENSIYVWSPATNTVNTSSTLNNENSLSLECGSAILIEQTTGQILYEHNIHEKLRPASVTKVMSILLIMEALDSRENKFNRQGSM